MFPYYTEYVVILLYFLFVSKFLSQTDYVIIFSMFLVRLRNYRLHGPGVCHVTRETAAAGQVLWRQLS